MIKFSIDGQPIPKARPRVSKKRAYTPARTAAWEDAVGWAARAAQVEPAMGDVYVSLQFWRKGKARADLDNLVKGVLDGLNGIAYDDDKQVVSLRATVEYGHEKPGVDVIIERID
jgi:crossover junction endodeoxyribonuclease RusA